MPTFAVCVLGAFSLSRQGRPLPAPAAGKPRSLLAFLVINRGRPIARDVLAETFWPDAPLEAARRNLKTALWSIRRALRAGGCDADALLVADAGTVRWTPDTVVDAEQLLAAAKNGDRDGLALYRGPFLEASYDDWVTIERERIEHAYESLLAALVGGDDGADFAEALIARNPFHEEAYRALIRRLLADGNVFAARSVYRKALRAFAEAGLEPDSSFVSQFAQLAPRRVVAPAPRSGAVVVIDDLHAMTGTARAALAVLIEAYGETSWGRGGSSGASVAMLAAAPKHSR
ncbi:MAG TPA: BTAD domain-containing putative transcriptional regulator [Candidatus Elarobacter sp.]|jgi:DNA-binding SARP family transcriptional activator